MTTTTKSDWTSASLGPYQAALDAALAEIATQKVMPRIWAGDHTVWKPEPREITNRLGWLHLPATMRQYVPELEAFAAEVQAAGYTRALLLGMGGSSLAPELYSKTFSGGRGAPSGRPHLQLTVLDSTDPGTVLAQAARVDPARALFIVSTKSGGTVETLSLFKYFYHQAAAALGSEKVGEHFIAITDPGSDLARLAEALHFRRTLLSDPTVGGRYSALAPFGLLPAALVGVNLRRLLERAASMAAACGPQVAAAQNPAARLGCALGELAKAGRDKATFVLSPELASFGDWVEQLIAESTGKEGRGILPVVGEPLGGPAVYGNDRFFVAMRLDGSPADDAGLDALQAAGFPLLRLRLRDAYDLGEQFYLWEMATAVAGARLGINPFDQPNVEAAKVLARRMVAEYMARGALPAETPTLTDEGIALYGDVAASSLDEALHAFLRQSQPGDYIALQAYLQPTAETDAALRALRTRLRSGYKLATTLSYAPRFLHSTGQLHKGDAGRGLFIQFTADDARDAPIPDEAGSPASTITFGVLKAAQALGDRQALLDAGRRVVRFHLGTDVVGGLKRLLRALPS